MSLAASQPLSTDPATNVNTNLHTYVLRAADIGRSEFSVAGLTLPNERKLTVSHETGKGGEQRHLVRFDRTEVDAVLLPATLSAYLVIVRPPSTAITNAICLQAVNSLVDFLLEGTNANVTAILNNEV